MQQTTLQSADRLSVRSVLSFRSREILDCPIDLAVQIRRDCPPRQPSPKKSTSLQEGDYSFFATRGDRRELHRAVLDVEDSIRCIPLAKRRPHCLGSSEQSSQHGTFCGELWD